MRGALGPNSDAYLMPVDYLQVRLQRLQVCNFCHAAIAEQFLDDFAVFCKRSQTWSKLEASKQNAI